MSPRQIAPRRFPWIGAILAFAAASRAAYLFAFRDDPFWSHLLHDAQRYHDWGMALAAGRPFETGAFSQAPLYPWIVGLLYRIVGPWPGAVYVLQGVLGVAAIALLARITRRAYGDDAVPFAAGIAALSGTLIFYESKLVPASLAVLLALLLADRMQVADASARAREWAVAGLVLGAAVLANSAFVLAAPAAILWVATAARPWSERARNAALLAVAAALVVLPVTVRNRVVSGEWVLVATNGGITFWQGNNPAAKGSFATPEGFSGSIHTQREEARVIASEAEGKTLSDAGASSHWMRRGVDYLRTNPSSALRLLGAKLALALASHEQPLEYDPDLDDNPLRPIFFVSFGVVAGFTVVRLCFVGRQQRAEGPIAGIAAVVLIVLLAFFVSSRYRLPLLALLCAPAGAGASLIVARARNGIAHAIAPVAIALGIAAASWAIVPLAFSDLERVQTAMALGDRGAALRAAGEFDPSIAVYQRALGLDPSYVYLHLDLGKSLRAAGQREAAESEIRAALRLSPELAEGWRDLGVVLYEANRLGEAEAAFAKAFALDPGDEAAANNLAGTRAKLGDIVGAREVIRVMRQRGLRTDPALERMTEQP